MAQAVATKVMGTVMTSSPGPMSRQRMARCRALVPLLTATHSWAEQYEAKAFSKDSTAGPRAKRQLSQTSRRAGCTSASMLRYWAFRSSRGTVWVAVELCCIHASAGWR